MKNKIIQINLFLLSLILLAGCESPSEMTPSPKPTVRVHVTSEPSGAYVTLQNGRGDTTPCDVEAHPGGTIMVENRDIFRQEAPGHRRGQLITWEAILALPETDGIRHWHVNLN